MSGSWISSSYDPYATGRPCSAANDDARPRSRLATATASARVHSRSAGSRARLIRAVDNSPQRSTAMSARLVEAGERSPRGPHRLDGTRESGVQGEVGDRRLDLLAGQPVAQPGGNVHGQLVDGAERDEDGDDDERAIAASQLGA